MRLPSADQPFHDAFLAGLGGLSVYGSGATTKIALGVTNTWVGASPGVYFSQDAGATWTRPSPISRRPFHAGYGNDTGQPNLGDYVGSTTNGASLLASWASTPANCDSLSTAAISPVKT